MQPGDLYQSPDRRDPYAPHPQQQQHQRPFPSSQTYPQQSAPGYDPYDNPPHAPANAPNPGQPFPVSNTYNDSFGNQNSGGAYADPFNDTGAGPGTGGGWANPQGSRHHPSYPNISSPPPPQIPYDHRQSLPPSNSIPTSMSSPPNSQNPLAPPPPRTRFDSNVSYLSNNSLPTTQSYGYNPDDGRLSSPPPLLPHNSSSSLGYPPRQGLPHSNSGSQYFGANNNDDDLDSAPLLKPATMDPRFGIPQSNSAMSMRHNANAYGGGGGGPARFQLNDNGPAGDVGVIPNRWKDNGQGANPMPGYGLGGNMPMDQEENNVHYGPVPTKVLRRNRTQKKVK